MFGYDETELPVGFDIRPHIFPGACACVYDYDYGVDPAFGAVSATAAMPPKPNLKSPQALRSWGRELWKRIAMNRGSWTTKEAQDAWGRIGSLAVSTTPQAMLADVISAGPGTKVKGADAFYKTVALMQQDVKAATKEPVIQATAGSMAYAIALAIASAKGAAGAAARRVLGAPVAVAAEARGALTTIVQEAGAAQARALDAATSVARMPGDVIREGVDSITEIPKHFADRVAQTADKLIDTAKDLSPQLAPFWAQMMQDAAGAAGKVGAGISFGVLALGGLVVAGIGAVYAGPAIAARITAKRR